MTNWFSRANWGSMIGIREILLIIYAIAWFIVIVITAWRTDEVPAELWGVLGLGVGVILGLFRADSAVRRGDGGTGKEDA